MENPIAKKARLQWEKLNSSTEKKERPTKALQQNIARKSGILTGFLNLRQGRPKKYSSPAIVDQELSPPDLNDFNPELTKVAPIQPKLNMARSTAGRPTSRPHYKDWKAPENARTIARAVNDCLDSEDPNGVTGEIIVPRGTLNYAT